MTEEGKAFVAPNLDKREPTRPLLIWCDTCDKQADRYMICDGGKDAAMVFGIHCHGEHFIIGIEDVEGFFEEIHVYRAPGLGMVDRKADFFHVFKREPEAPPPSGVENDPFTL